MQYKKLEVPDDREAGDAAAAVMAEVEDMPAEAKADLAVETPTPFQAGRQTREAAPTPPGHRDNKRLIHLAQLVGLLLLAFLAYTGAFARIADGIGGHYMDDVNRNYIQAASESAAELVEVLSASKVVLALLTSSKGGISFFIDIEVQLGQALNTVYEMVNYAWLFALASLAATKILALLLDLGRLSMAPVLTLFFCSMGLWLGLRSRLPSIAGMLSETARLLLFAALLVHFVLPLSVYGVAAAGHHFFQGHKKEVYESFSTLHATLPKHDPQADLHSQVESNVRHFKDRQGTLDNTSATLSDLTAKHIVLVLGEYLFVPLILLSALALLSWFVLKRAWYEMRDRLPEDAPESSRTDPALR